MLRSCFVGLMSLLAVTASRGADLQVREGFPPPFYSTIQSAIEDAEEGDNVLVFPGTYNERINFLGKGITVRGVGPLPSLHKIDGIGDGSQISGALVEFTSGESAEARLEGFTITNGSASEGAGCYISNSASPTIENCVFSNCVSTSGGAIRVSNATAEFIGVRFDGNRASQDGGAIYSNNSQVRLEGCSFDACFVERSTSDSIISVGGGAISSSGLSLHVEDCTFSECYAYGYANAGCNTAIAYTYGGAIRASGQGHTLKIDSSSFTDCYLSLFVRDRSSCNGCCSRFAYGGLNGGVIFVDTPGGSTEITGTTILRPRFDLDLEAGGDYRERAHLETRRGVAIAVSSGELLISSTDIDGARSNILRQTGNTYFTGGVFERNGSALSANSTDPVVLNSVNFTDCKSSPLYVDGNLRIDSSNVGGAVFACSGSSLDWNGGSCQSNQAYRGGAIYFDNGSIATISGVTFSSNTVVSEGGAIDASSTNLSIENSLFEFNSAQDEGGALRVDGNPNQVTLSSVDFIGNIADDRGGAVASYDSVFNLNDVNFVQNVAGPNGQQNDDWSGYGGALRAADSSGRIFNTTFSENVARGGGSSQGAAGGAVYLYSGDQLRFESCLFDENLASATGVASGGAVFLDDNDTKPSFLFTEFRDNQAVNLDQDDQYSRGGAIYCEDRTEPYVLGNIFLRNSAEWGSAVYSTNSSPFLVESVFRDNSSQNSDSGAIQTVGSDIPYVLNDYFCGNTPADFYGDVYSGSPSESFATCESDCNNDGIPDADQPEIPDINGNEVPDTCESDCNDDGVPDIWQLSQSLLNDCNGNGIVDSCDIDSGVSDDADADGVPDECDPRVPSEYLVPQDFSSIQEAVNQSSGGDTIVVSPGVYYEALNLDGKNVHLRSVGGPGVTYIDRNGSSGQAISWSNAPSGAALEGFTVWGASGSIGLSVRDTLLKVQNCVFNFHGNRGVEIFGGTPTFQDCQFMLNNIGLRVEEYSTAIFEDCTFAANTRAAEIANNDAEPNPNSPGDGCSFIRTDVVGNGPNGGTAGFVIDTSSPSFEDCYFALNEGGNEGGG